MGSQLYFICVLIKYKILWLINNMAYGKLRWPESLHDKDYTGDRQPANVVMVCPLFYGLGHAML